MSNFKTSVFTSVSSIPKAYWDSLNCCENIYYSPHFLEAFEKANTTIDFKYIFILKETKAVAFGYSQLVTIGIETIIKNIKISEGFKSKINRFFNANSPRILFCGNVFLSGEYGTYLKTGEDKHLLFGALADALKTIAKNTDKLSAIFVKDFKTESLDITKQLEENFDYIPMVVEPNMIIYLEPEWQSFNDYKNALKSKYRIKANKADSLSENLVAKLFSSQDIEIYKDQLQALYENTIANANFNAQILDLNTYTYLKAHYDESFIVKGYFLEDKLVGFLSAMINQDNLDAHFIGLDYTLNKEYGIYPRILNDYVRLGIEHQSSKINLGRTASEIKSTLGAQPEALTCYLRHKKTLQNQVIKPFIRNVKIKTFKQHQPFKGQKKEAI